MTLPFDQAAERYFTPPENKAGIENYIRGLILAKSLYQTLHSGGCRIVSLGSECKCFLCQIDNEIAEAKEGKLTTNRK